MGTIKRLHVSIVYNSSLVEAYGFEDIPVDMMVPEKVKNVYLICINSHAD